MFRIAVGLVIVCVLLLGARIVYRQHNPPAQLRLTTPGHSNYYMNDAVAYQMDKQGHLAYRTRVAQTLHFPDGSTQLSNIGVHYVQGTKTYWDLTAAHGTVPPGQRIIYLEGGVSARHPRPDGPIVRVATDHAWVAPKAGRVGSNALVKAIEPGQMVTGDGIRVNLNTNKLRLLKNVHVTYRP
jgi:LPS export ABC transporter protein LptC